MPKVLHGTSLNGTRSKDEAKCMKCAYISICRLCVEVLSIFMRQKYFFASNMSASGCVHIGSLFANEGQKKVGNRLTGYLHFSAVDVDTYVFFDVLYTMCQVCRFDCTWPFLNRCGTIELNEKHFV